MPRFINSPLRSARKKRSVRRSKRSQKRRNTRSNTRKQRGGRGGLGGASYHGAFTTGATQVAGQLNTDEYD